MSDISKKHREILNERLLGYRNHRDYLELKKYFKRDFFIEDLEALVPDPYGNFITYNRDGSQNQETLLAGFMLNDLLSENFSVSKKKGRQWRL